MTPGPLLLFFLGVCVMVSGRLRVLSCWGLKGVPALWLGATYLAVSLFGFLIEKYDIGLKLGLLLGIGVERAIIAAVLIYVAIAVALFVIALWRFGDSYSTSDSAESGTVSRELNLWRGTVTGLKILRVGVTGSLILLFVVAIAVAVRESIKETIRDPSLLGPFRDMAPYKLHAFNLGVGLFVWALTKKFGIAVIIVFLLVAVEIFVPLILR